MMKEYEMTIIEKRRALEWGYSYARFNLELGDYEYSYDSRFGFEPIHIYKDIISMGFRYDPIKDYYVSNKSFLGLSVGDDCNLVIDIYDEYRIYFLNNKGEIDVRFNGYIDSTEELKLVLTKYLKIDL